ncbi:MAG: class I SAM-dependent methyltransferase [Candidatus Woesearchaeota archaeon]
MVNKLYSGLSRVCHTFYRMYFPHQKIAATIDNYLRQYNCNNIVFFGGLTDVAVLLKKKGYNLTFVDYTSEMVHEAKKTLKGVTFKVSDMRNLNLSQKQDAIILMGRIMTYMYTDKDMLRALAAFKRNLKPGGILLFDNYETGKIDKVNYFQGTIRLSDKTRVLRRVSTIRQLKKQPALYNWDCVYEENINGKKILYKDQNHLLRAVTREEIKSLVNKSSLKFIKNSPNFESQSFITLAQK